jgi:tetratricopeptide (TPR) repeat protein
MRFSVVAAAILATGAAAVVGAGARAPSGRDVGRLPGGLAVRSADIRFYRARADRDPQSAADRAQLAGLYLQHGRETGSPGDFARAAAWAESSLAIRRTRNGRAQLVLASSLLARHRFPQALEVARDLVVRVPDEPAYRALLGELELEMGDYERARATFRSLEASRTHLAVAPRLARWAEIEGLPGLARELLAAGLAEAERRPDLPAEQLAWFHLRLGDLELRAGRLSHSRRALERGLAMVPDDGRLRAAMARLEAATHRWKRARYHAARAATTSPDPATLALLGDIQAALGDPAAAESAYLAVERLAAERPEPFNRAWTLFRLDHQRHVAEAVALLRQEIQVRRDVYGYDQLAWGLFLLGELGDARAASDSARRMHTQDPILFFHAAMIERAQGDTAAARRDLRHALSLNPRFHHRFAGVAQAVLDSLGGP